MQRPILLVVLLTACGKAEPARSADSVARTPPAAVAASPADTAAGSCPATGRWAQCSLIERLERSGLVPRVDSSSRPDEPPLSVPGTLVRVGNSELELYLYTTTSAREAEAAKLDTAKYIAYTAPVPFQPRPTLIQSANLIAVLHSRNDHQRERVGDAITAGPPLPARP